MKKSAFACLAVLTMSLAVSAASADDYVTLAELGRQAADGWHQTYQANGREIVADAETVFYPTGEQCPIVQVEGLGKDENDSVFDVHRQKKNSSIYAFDMSLSVDVLDDDSVNYVPWQELGKGKLYQERTFFYHGEEPNIAAENVDLTYSEFKKHVDEELNRTLGLTLEQFYQYRVWVSQPAYRAVMVDGQKTPGKLLQKMGSYILEDVQNIHGLPLLDGALHKRPNGSIMYAYSCPNYYYFSFSCSKEISVIEEDVPLLAFDKMKEKWEALIDDGHLRCVDELTFGCVPCKQGDKWVTFPVWRIKGSYTDNVKSDKMEPIATDVYKPEEYYEYDFNAQTGELLGIKEDVFAMPKVLTWDDVNR